MSSADYHISFEKVSKHRYYHRFGEMVYRKKHGWMFIVSGDKRHVFDENANQFPFAPLEFGPYPTVGEATFAVGEMVRAYRRTVKNGEVEK